MIDQALQAVVAEGGVAGIALWEISLSEGPESDTDHAAKWETSNMLHFYPGLVDMQTLGQGPLAPDMQPPHGIGGLDPRVHASAEVGERNATLAAEGIGRKAQELLASLPAGEQDFSLEGINPEFWWMV
jgi:creatinine amidohydrolase/Fe(II)-dependent formamide hydrolase-like protein